MDEEQIEEMLDRLGYSGARLSAMRRYLSEYRRRKLVLEAGALTVGDIVSASIIFDGFNRAGRGK